MINTILGYASSSVVIAAVCYVAGGLTWQKLIDKVTGVPSTFRTAMSALEVKAKADVNAAIADVVGKFTPAATKVAAAPVATVAPVAPAPVAPAVEPPKA